MARLTDSQKQELTKCSLNFLKEYAKEAYKVVDKTDISMYDWKYMEKVREKVGGDKAMFNDLLVRKFSPSDSVKMAMVCFDFIGYSGKNKDTVIGTAKGIYKRTIQEYNIFQTEMPTVSNSGANYQKTFHDTRPRPNGIYNNIKDELNKEYGGNTAAVRIASASQREYTAVEKSVLAYLSSFIKLEDIKRSMHNPTAINCFALSCEREIREIKKLASSNIEQDKKANEEKKEKSSQLDNEGFLKL